MTVFFIEHRLALLEMNSTTSISVNLPSSAPKHRMEDGRSVSDNIDNENKEISFSGLITNIKSLRISDGLPLKPTEQYTEIQTSLRSPADYVLLLEAIRDTKEPFIVHWDELLPAAENCVFTNISLSRDKNTGRGFRINLSFQQLRFTSRALLTEVISQRDPDKNQSKTESSGNSTTTLESGDEVTVISFIPGIGSSTLGPTDTFSQGGE